MTDADLDIALQQKLSNPPEKNFNMIRYVENVVLVQFLGSIVIVRRRNVVVVEAWSVRQDEDVNTFHGSSSCYALRDA